MYTVNDQPSRRIEKHTYDEHPKRNDLDFWRFHGKQQLFDIQDSMTSTGRPEYWHPYDEMEIVANEWTK
jgi:hypothetical protein